MLVDDSINIPIAKETLIFLAILSSLHQHLGDCTEYIYISVIS